VCEGQASASNIKSPAGSAHFCEVWLTVATDYIWRGYFSLYPANLSMRFPDPGDFGLEASVVEGTVVTGELLGG